MRGEAKQEASMSVQSRINVATLAELDMYWMSEDKRIRSLSQLVAWSMDLLSEILWANQKMERRIESVAEARNYLIRRDLCQHSLHNRGITKMSKAIMFENMRNEGTEPKIYANRQYKSLHRNPEENGKPSTVEPFTEKVDGELIKRAVETYNKTLTDEIKVAPYLSQEYENRDKTNDGNKVVKSEDAAEFVKVSRERSEKDIPLLKEKGNSREVIEAQIRKADEDSQKKLNALNNIDFTSLMASAVKEK